MSRCFGGRSNRRILVGSQASNSAFYIRKLRKYCRQLSVQINGWQRALPPAADVNRGPSTHAGNSKRAGGACITRQQLPMATIHTAYVHHGTMPKCSFARLFCQMLRYSSALQAGGTSQLCQTEIQAATPWFRVALNPEGRGCRAKTRERTGHPWFEHTLTPRHRLCNVTAAACKFEKNAGSRSCKSVKRLRTRTHMFASLPACIARHKVCQHVFSDTIGTVDARVNKKSR